MTQTSPVVTGSSTSGHLDLDGRTRINPVGFPYGPDSVTHEFGGDLYEHTEYEVEEGKTYFHWQRP